MSRCAKFRQTRLSLDDQSHPNTPCLSEIRVAYVCVYVWDHDFYFYFICIILCDVGVYVCTRVSYSCVLLYVCMCVCTSVFDQRGDRSVLSYESILNPL